MFDWNGNGKHDAFDDFEMCIRDRADTVHCPAVLPVKQADTVRCPAVYPAEQADTCLLYTSRCV